MSTSNDRSERRDAPDLDDRMARLRERLDAETAEREARSRPTKGEKDRTAMGQALRLSSEFVAAVVVGAAIGYGIDWAFGTAPWGLVIFLLLGFAAAVVNVMRSAGLMAPSSMTITAARDAADRNEPT